MSSRIDSLRDKDPNLFEIIDQDWLVTVLDDVFDHPSSGTERYIMMNVEMMMELFNLSAEKARVFAENHATEIAPGLFQFYFIQP